MKRGAISILVTGMLFLLALPGYGLSVEGHVFVDVNSDGVMQSSEKGIAETAVSDGLQVTITDSSGHFRIETMDGRFVFVSLPRGYKATTGFYRIAEAGKPVDIPLTEWPETAGDSLRFLQITDLHIRDDKSAQVVIGDLAGAKDMVPAPAFVIATGDLVENGANVPEFHSLEKAISGIRTPIFRGIGNHDVLGGNENYQKFCGPRYYSFNAGGCHFVMLDCTRIDEEQKAWLKHDIAAAPEDATRIFLMHYLPNTGDLKLIADLGGSAVFSGHWHGSRIGQRYGVLSVNTPPFRFAGLDRTPASFELVEVENGIVTSELRLTGQQKRLTIVSPAGKVSARDGKIEVLVNAYDTWAGVDRVDCRIDGQSYRLTRKGQWSWAGEVPLKTTGATTRHITAYGQGDNGSRWSTSAAFKIDRASLRVEAGGDWPQWRGTPLHAGSSDDVVWPPLRLAWAASAGGMIGMSSPMVSDGVVAVGVSNVGNLETRGVAAFDAITGKQRWYYQTDSAVKSSPAIAEGRVFVISVTGYLYALDINTGALLWKKGMLHQAERWEVASPAVADGIVYAGGAYYLAAFEVDSGHLLWERYIQDSEDSSGKKLWNHSRYGGGDWVPNIYGVPTPVGDKLLIATRGGLFALEISTGRPLWMIDGRTNAGAAVIEVEDSKSVFYTIQNMLATAIDVESGKVLWSSKERIGDTASSPAIAEGKMVVGTVDGRVCAFDTKDGALLWSYHTEKAIADTMPYVRGSRDVNCSPVISGDTVYFGAGDGRMYAISLENGEEIWSYSIGTPISSSPAVSGNAVYTAAYDGNVYAFVGAE